jgi:ribA/ribD-fused uncharacterized protein
MKIKEFQGEYRWLSNFAPVSIILGDWEYNSVEHAYMSAKSDDEDWKILCASENMTAGQIKRKSRDIALVDNWNEIKLSVMKECIKQKFKQEPYKSKLMATKDFILEEGNTWGDEFWGINLKTGRGQNNLGKLIMSVREGLV